MLNGAGLHAYIFVYIYLLNYTVEAVALSASPRVVSVACA